MKNVWTAFATLLVGVAPAGGEMVVERWGVAGRIQHPGTLLYELRGREGRAMRFDLSALPQDAKVYRARLFFRCTERHRTGYDIVAAVRAGTGPDAELKPTGRALETVAPYHRWLDATEAVRRSVRGGDRALLLWVRKAGAGLSIVAEAGSAGGLRWAENAPDFGPGAAWLEIAYELDGGAARAGALRSPPKQVREVKAFYRSGQVFVTFREAEDYAARLLAKKGKEALTWGDLGERFRTATLEGMVPRDDGGELRYRVYAHDKPITPASIGAARLLGEVAPGSVYNTRLAPKGDFAARRPKAVALRLAIQPGEPLPHATGLYVHTVGRGDKPYYAVVSARDGVENTLDVSQANAVGPIEQRPAEPAPVLQEDRPTKLRPGGTYHHQRYSWWCAPPLAPRPLRYDLAVGFCPEATERPSALTVTRGHFTHHGPEMPGPSRRRDVVMSHSCDGDYHGVWTGVHDAEYTLKGFERGRWQPFTQRRQEALVAWMKRRWEIDEQRIRVCLGSWGMWELRRGELYAYLHGWGMPEISKGFQCWHWTNGVWGPHHLYARKPNEENPFYLHDYTRYVRQDPRKELPFFAMHTGWGDHFTEMGWPPFPRFVRAMMDTKRAFCMHSRALDPAMRAGLIEFRRDASVPAFGNCSLDDNIGEGDLGSGRTFGQINGYLAWESRTIVDEPGGYEITVLLWDSAPLAECTVDLTPRRCRAFRPKGGARFAWQNVALDSGRQVQAGSAEADEHGLVTVRGLRVAKRKHRIVIRAKE